MPTYTYPVKDDLITDLTRLEVWRYLSAPPATTQEAISAMSVLDRGIPFLKARTRIDRIDRKTYRYTGAPNEEPEDALQIIEFNTDYPPIPPDAGPITASMLDSLEADHLAHLNEMMTTLNYARENVTTEPERLRVEWLSGIIAVALHNINQFDRMTAP